MSPKKKVDWILGKELISCVQNEDIEKIVEILKSDNFGSIPKHCLAVSLFRAVSSNNIVIAKLLLNAGADVNGFSDFIPLVVAAQQSYCELVEVLLLAKADPNKKDENTFTALMYAALNGHLPIAQLLIKAGADRDLENYEGERAMDLAIRSDNQQIIFALENSQ